MFLGDICVARGPHDHICKGIRGKRHALLSSPPDIAGSWFSPRYSQTPKHLLNLVFYLFGCHKACHSLSPYGDCCCYSCETMPGPQYILRKYDFNSGGQFTMTRYYFTDEVRECLPSILLPPLLPLLPLSLSSASDACSTSTTIWLGVLRCRLRHSRKRTYLPRISLLVPQRGDRYEYRAA